jgi:hypothetical protein
MRGLCFPGSYAEAGERVPRFQTRHTRRSGLPESSPPRIGLITAWYRDGSQVPVDQLSYILMHEMGHALGLASHSPNPGDIMYPWTRPTRPGSMAESWVVPPKGQELTDRDRETLRKLYAKPNVLGGTRRVY